MQTFQERLTKAMREGNLTVADLARWFSRPHPTVRGWVMGGALGGAWLDTAEIEALLQKLENRIKKRNGFPVPRLSPTDRIQYLTQIRSAL